MRFLSSSGSWSFLCSVPEQMKQTFQKLSEHNSIGMIFQNCVWIKGQRRSLQPLSHSIKSRAEASTADVSEVSVSRRMDLPYHLPLLLLTERLKDSTRLQAITISLTLLSHREYQQTPVESHYSIGAPISPTLSSVQVEKSSFHCVPVYDCTCQSFYAPV